jgi:hypothetical protein
VEPQDFGALEKLEAERARRFAVIDEIRAAFKDEPDKELEREVARAVTEARAEARGERTHPSKRP